MRSPSVHVWTAFATGDTLPSDCLSADERARAERLLSDPARRSFIAGRALLRHVLGGLLQLPPEALRFTVRPGGKPALEGTSRLEFSLSHAGEVVLLAVSDGLPVGADVEFIRPLLGAASIAAAYFPPDQRDAFLRLPAPRPPEAFFRVWTRLEAQVKTTGEGFRGIRAPGGDLPLKQWDPLPGYIAAVAAAAAFSLHLHTWQGMIACPPR